MLKNLLLVGLGGGLGSILRYGSSLLVPAKQFPWPTFLVNILGSFIIGMVFALSTRDEQFLNTWKLFLATGLCGGFTTFSAFSAENLQLVQQGKYPVAVLYIVLSIVLGIAAAFLGYQLIIKN